MDFDLTSLNPEQLQPVMNTEGAVLVTAGAGSGKTKVLTSRIAYLLLTKHIDANSILAITFTNKAATEMKERLVKMGAPAKYVLACTFHSFGTRVLRENISYLRGYSANFSIYGENEKECLIRRILKQSNNETAEYKQFVSFIGRAKTENISPDDCAKIYAWHENIGEFVEIYTKYEKELQASNAFDFDDLINKTLFLLKTNKDVLQKYQERFQYIFVDEFQDTNPAQYEITRLLSIESKNIFVVGDEDQSIYGWRGASHTNILDFIKDFNAKVYKLEQNYRSSQNILDLANKIIANNKGRLEKRLWTQNGVGADVEYYAARSDGDEADFAVKTIYNLMKTKGYKLSDFAILMRINALSRSFEERFMQYGVPHRIFGGFKFYDRKEVKDVLAYMKIIGNHNDNEAIMRVINFPKRGIGDGAVGQLVNYAAVTGQSLYDVIYALETNEDLPKSLIKKVLPFTNVLQCLENAAKSGSSLYELVRYIVKVAGFIECYEEDTEENQARKNNIRELANGIEQFEKDNPSAGLDDYLQQISLYSDLDEMTDENNCVNIATIHSAKGLEFKVVFLVGLEEGIFPDSRRAESDGDMEEERRLMYVAVTRAKERLYLTRAKSRFRYGQHTYAMPSKFLTEGGFEEERESVNSYAQYSGRYDSYRGPRAYSSYDDGYNAEEVPVYAEAPRSSVKTEAKPALVRQVSKPQAKDAGKYRIGTKVRHKKFGEGTVVGVSQAGETCVEVDFTKLGKLKLILAYAPLEVIE